ncbi:hypothetical protein JCM10908_002972 [Rhodotorula pacifica]|uniref:fungal specific transcription factor domain-containing protein n=1 Tax=Rhodotorula pacifica TaxID=1495444 RepID=UPI003175D642
MTTEKRAVGAGTNKAKEPRHYCLHPGCGKDFARRDHLKRHAANHDPQRAKPCPECGRLFARPDVLAAHLKKHDLGSGQATAIARRSSSPRTYFQQESCSNGNTATAEPELRDPMEELADPADFENLYQWLTDGINGENGASTTPAFAQDPYAMTTAAMGHPDPSWMTELPSTTTLAGPSHAASLEHIADVPLDESHQLALLGYFSTFPALVASPSFALPVLSDALSRYWALFDPHVPIVHRPTFHPSSSVGLLAAILTAGLCLSDSESDRLLGATLHRHLRPLLMLHEVSSWPVSLAAFQALCIVGQVGQMLLGQEEHRFSYPYSAFEVTLGRSTDIFSWRFFAKMMSSLRLKRMPEEKWRGWAEIEAWRRVAHCILLRDIQLRSVFQQPPTHSFSHQFIRLTLPCNDDKWYAPSARSWQAVPSTTDVPFPHALKSAISPTSFLSSSFSSSAATAHLHLNPFAMNPFARYCLVHGLMGVACDLKGRGTLRDGMLDPVSASRTWRDSLLGAYRQIRADVNTALGLPFLTPAERIMSRSTLDLLLIAELETLVDLTSILTFAGVDRIARNTDPGNLATASQAVQDLALSDEGLEAAVVAAHYLRGQLSFGDSSQASKAGPSFAPWSLYIATLVLWTVTALRPPPPLELSGAIPVSEFSALHQHTLDFPILHTFPHSWQPKDATTLLQHVSAKLARYDWELSREAAGVLQSLCHRKL